ncbi:MAG: hypothetical protein II531_05370 [Bacteroidales bacterium]|nr:hypothetical protein [Bacteroidales bacterium]
MKHPLIVLALMLLSLAPVCEGQHESFLRRSELIVGGGGMGYIGDLNEQSALGIPRGGVLVGMRTRFDNRWAMRWQLAYGSIASPDDDVIVLRNLSFRSTLWEFSGVAEFNFVPFGNGSGRLWSPYIFGGFALFHFNPETSYIDADGNRQWVELQPLHTEGQASSVYPDRQPYSLFQLSLPFGVGVKFWAGKIFSLTVQYGFRKTWTDYLDDVSTTYVEPEAFGTGADGALAQQLADRSGEVVPGYVNAPGIKRGDDSLDDWYSFFDISIGINMETLFGWMHKTRCKMNN